MLLHHLAAVVVLATPTETNLTTPPASETAAPYVERHWTETTTSASTGETASAGIAWFADWDAGLAEATRSQRPIILQFMRPACRGVSGVF